MSITTAKIHIGKIVNTEFLFVAESEEDTSRMLECAEIRDAEYEGGKYLIPLREINGWIPQMHSVNLEGRDVLFQPSINHDHQPRRTDARYVDVAWASLYEKKRD